MIDAKEAIGAKFVKKVKSCDMIKAKFPLKFIHDIIK